MFTLFRMALILLIVCLPLPVTACGPKVQIVKKPVGLRKENPDPTHPYLTAGDRSKWKSVLNWCDECDKKAKPFTEAFDGKYGTIFIAPIGDNQYIVDIWCGGTWTQSRHIYYKITEHADTIESRLLMLEQFHFLYAENESGGSVEEPKEDPKGRFIRFTDSLIYGFTVVPENNAKQLVVQKNFRGSGGCGLYTVYDVSGDCPKVIEFRARPYCSANYVPSEKWTLYPPEQRAKWPIAPNPLREDWKPSPTPACSK